MTSRLPWSEILALPAVALAARVLARLHGLGLGYVDRAGAVLPPRPSAAPGVGRAVQDREVGEAARRAAAVAALAAASSAEPFERRCHADLLEIAAPIEHGGAIVGALVAGGFADVDDAPVAAPPGIAIDEWAAATAAHPRLATGERRAIAALLAEAAAAAAAHLARTGARPGPVSEPGRGSTARYAYDGIVGRGAAMQGLYRLLDRVVESDATVLVTGENGTGKELIARAIHHHSARTAHRFVVQNCSAFNDNLLDSELFGHRRGAFTGAIADKPGLFEVADRGTFFLDEIGDMSPALQVKLLRVLQEGTFTAVGDTDVRKVDVRIVAATHRDLRRMVERGEFREDLYYRVNVINLVAPPLRERKDDLPLLIEHFLGRGARPRRRSKVLSDGCLEAFLAYPWPGNVRELENEIERLVVLAGDDRVIEADLLSPRIRDPRPPEPAPAGGNLPEAVDRLERGMIGDALARHGGNKTRAAAELGISRRNLIRLSQKYGFD